MKPYGERKKRRPGGREHWIFTKPRSSQNKKIKQRYRYGWDGDLSDKSQQRNQARDQGKQECDISGWV